MAGSAGSKYGIINDGVPTTTRDSVMQKIRQEQYSREDLIDLVQDLMDYTLESSKVLGFDDREPEIFVDIFLERRKKRLMTIKE